MWEECVSGKYGMYFCGSHWEFCLSNVTSLQSSIFRSNAVIPEVIEKSVLVYRKHSYQSPERLKTDSDCPGGFFFF